MHRFLSIRGFSLIALTLLASAATAVPLAHGTSGLKCLGKSATKIGTASSETLYGTSGADVIVGLGGGDTIKAQGGADLICGGSGADHLFGAAGDDSFNGGLGSDTCSQGAGSGTMTSCGSPPAPPPPPPGCDPSYPTVCIKPPPPDLDCGQVPYEDFKVVGADPHGFDGDNDGVGCES